MSKNDFVIRVMSFTFQDKCTLECEWCGAAPERSCGFSLIHWHVAVHRWVGLVWPKTPLAGCLHEAVCRGEGLGEARGSSRVLYIRASSWGFFWTKGSEVNNSFVSYSHGCSGVKGFQGTEMVPGCRLGWLRTQVRFRQQMGKTRIWWLEKSAKPNDLRPNYPVFQERILRSEREGHGVWILRSE